MRVLAHPDPVVLERKLLELLAESAPGRPIERRLVLVPSARLAAHVRRKLASAGDGRGSVGVEVATLHGLARSVLERRGGGAPPRVLSTRMRDALVRAALRGRPTNLWSSFAERRPGILSRLGSTVNELREAGVRPQALADCARGDRWNEALAEIYALYVLQLGTRVPEGWVDEAGLILAAAEQLAGLGDGWARIVVHGAYEWIGVHVRLLRELARLAPLTALVPVAPGSRVTRYAERFVRERLLEGGGRIEPLETDPAPGCGLRLESLYDEASRPEPAPAERLVFWNVQGAMAEVELAVHGALRAIADGTPATEIAIVARSLEPYGAALEAALEDAGVPWTSTLELPLRRRPIVRDFLVLLEAVSADFPRRPTALLLRSPRLRWTALPDVDRPPRGDLVEPWSRKARIIGGLDEWSEVLGAWAARRGKADEAELIARALRGLVDRVPTAPGSWSDHAARLSRIFEELFDPGEADPERQAAAALTSLIDEMAWLQSATGEVDTVSFAAARGWLEEAVQGASQAPWEADRGGLRVLDAMQFRGLTFEHVFLLGMTSGVFPRRAPEDPLLGDDLRRRLREREGLALVVRSEGPEEERGLLAMIVGGSRQRLDVVWQRADDAGRARATSLAVRELFRLASGDPACRDAVRVVPSHPQLWLDYLAGPLGVLSPEEALLREALQSRSDAVAASLSKRDGRLRDGLAMIAATEAFEIVDPAFDARLRGRHDPGRLSVTAVERLGRCPLQFFFRDVLGIEEIDPAASAEELSAAELGGSVHDLLARLYAGLAAEGLFAPGRGDELRARAGAWLEDERRRMFGDLGERLTRRLPTLWELTLSAWFEALRSFVSRDLARIVGEGWRPDGFEVPIAARLELGGAQTLDLDGRLDRRWTRSGETLIGDYKTSGRLAERVERRAMLKGLALQVPLYAVMSGDDPTVELLGVGPRFESADDNERQATFEGFGSAEERAGFLETLGTLAGLVRDGLYPLRADGHCAWCAYRLACRRSHPPTLHRETLDEAGRRYAALQGKNTRQPRLSPAKEPLDG